MYVGMYNKNPTTMIVVGFLGNACWWDLSLASVEGDVGKCEHAAKE